MRLVENVNLEAVACWTIPRPFPQFADLVDATVGGGVNFNYVNCIPSANFGAGITHAAWLGHGFIRRAAVQCHRQNASHGSLADPSMSAEDIAVRSASLLDRILQSASDVLLPNHL